MRRKGTFLTFLLLLIIAIVFISSCSFGSESSAPQEEKIKVYTTIYPLYDFAVKIAGEKAKVQSVIPAGVEAHDFEPSPKLMAEIYQSDVFIFLGSSIDPWAEKLAEQLAKEGVTVVEAGQDLIQKEAPGGGHDPHVWLDPVMAMAIAEKIAGALTAADGENATYYEENLKELKRHLKILDGKYREALSSVKKRDFVVNHAAFGYLARRYNLNQIAISGLSPQQEPSPKKLAELSKICRERDIKYIFFETSASSKLADALAREVGAGVLVLHTLENLTEDEIKAGEDYFSIMEKNLKNLMTALGE
ncbi:MAG: zinc ABC transporter substrate-binding protein [Thermosediminibacteraceae bacterium]|nr:zinc ABC transporter substrate-binding protein [Thermosediminibacteraceae bacterium]